LNYKDTTDREISGHPISAGKGEVASRKKGTWFRYRVKRESSPGKESRRPGEAKAGKRRMK